MEKPIKCVICGDVFEPTDLEELKEMHEHFHINPFICPDCYDNVGRKDLEDQFNVIYEGEQIVEIPLAPLSSNPPLVVRRHETIKKGEKRMNGEDNSRQELAGTLLKAAKTIMDFAMRVQSEADYNKLTGFNRITVDLDKLDDPKEQPISLSTVVK